MTSTIQRHCSSNNVNWTNYVKTLLGHLSWCGCDISEVCFWQIPLSRFFSNLWAVFSYCYISIMPHCYTTPYTVLKMGGGTGSWLSLVPRKCYVTINDLTLSISIDPHHILGRGPRDWPNHFSPEVAHGVGTRPVEVLQLKWPILGDRSVYSQIGLLKNKNKKRLNQLKKKLLYLETFLIVATEMSWNDPSANSHTHLSKVLGLELECSPHIHTAMGKNGMMQRNY